MEKILVVDDEKDITEVLSEYLEKEGYKVYSANDPDEADKILSSQNIALLITDIKMPKKSGLELVEKYKKGNEDMEVIIISALKDINMAIEAMRYGAFSYLLKPFNLSDVLINVKNAIERRRLVLENKKYQEELERIVEERTKELKNALKALEESYFHTLKVLVETLDVRDIETEGHSIRVVEYAVLIAKEMGIEDPKFLNDLKIGALLHDIGKVGVPDRILRKKGPLTVDEMKAMRAHTVFGHKIISSVEFLKGAAEIVLYHHERWDGKGYPFGRKGESIPLGARIFAVADAFDAMIFDRRYRKALSIREAIEELKRGKGTQFDPNVVEAFLRIPLDKIIKIKSQTPRRLEDIKEIIKLEF
ncbi:MAG: response regulator [Candidatus Aminicenantes bacterium]|nr:response regulator [Candidatus Aminicenantes bacterium]